MRDIFEDMFGAEPPDPVASARRGMRPPLRRRFYAAATVGERAGDGYPVLLDGKSVRTPAGRALAAPHAELAQAIAQEWEAQRELIDSQAMPLTRLANTIVDAVTGREGEVAAEIEKYLASDLVCYRADAPVGLVARQRAHWDPILAWARDDVSARFVLAQGIVHVAQPAAAVAAMARLIPASPWPLGAVHVATTLTGSALIALALAAGAITVEAAWTAAHVDEDWNMELWGREELSFQRRAYREAEMRAAATVLGLAR